MTSPSSQNSSHVWMWVLDCKESWVPKNWCFWTVVLEKTLESPLDCKEFKPIHPEGVFIVLSVHWKGWCWSWNSNTLATWCEELTHLKRPWCWERLKAGGEGDDRVWDHLMVSPTWWTWVWVSSRSWWWTGRPGVLQSMGSQRVGHDWATELNSLFMCHLHTLCTFPQGPSFPKGSVLVIEVKSTQAFKSNCLTSDSRSVTC